MQAHEHKPAITAELGALRPANKDGKQVQQPQELCKYAFVQHALRELRAHTSLWSSNLKSTAPKGFAGRAGYEHCRANVGDVISMQAHWPFHLAGDSGGQPEGIVQSFNTLFASKIEKTHAAASEARRRLGW